MSRATIGRMTRGEYHASIDPINVGAAEAATLMRISKRTLATETAAGRIPSFKIRGRRLYNVEALKRYSAEQSSASDQ
ncbi:helix-turn-helix domain-containing protein [Lacipirellula limnantheis]|nr:helix-turn-helix domain-containing protein [Lacipirellula limnantheis]